MTDKVIGLSSRPGRSHFPVGQDARSRVRLALGAWRYAICSLLPAPRPLLSVPAGQDARPPVGPSGPYALLGRRLLDCWSVGLSTLYFLLFALCLFLAGAKESPAAGLNVQNFKPALDASGGGVLLDATQIGHLMYRFDYAFSYARNPLEYGRGGRRNLGVVDHLLYNDLTAGFGLTPSLDVGLSVPYGIVYDYLETGSESRKTGTGLGDIRFGFRDTLFNKKDVPIRLALAASANFPAGYKNDYLGNGGFEGDFRAVSEAKVGDYRLIVNLGYLVRGANRSVNLKLDDQMTWGIGSRSS